MGKRLLLFVVLLFSALCLSGCSKFPKLPDFLHKPTETPAPVISTRVPLPLSNSPLTYLYYSESSSYFKRVQGYEYRAEDGKHTAYFHMAHEEELYPVPVDQVWVDTLNSFITQYNMTRWNGFSGSAAGLLDGTQFYVEFTLSDGTNVKAGGYGDFPDGYGGASQAIDAHFLQLLPEDMRDW